MALKAPLATYEKIFTLPMLTIKEDKGMYYGSFAELEVNCIIPMSVLIAH